jgi:orotidine-5'-phosphate decarboxylase
MSAVAPSRAPSARRFFDLWRAAAARAQSLVCVGLDPEPERFPAPLRAAARAGGRDGQIRAIVDFNRAIVDATCDLVCAYKPQIAHYAGAGAEAALEETIRYINARAPDVPVILDAKRSDIGSTAQKYAEEAFVRYGADAVTVNPYLGRDSVEPFLEHADKGVVILCRTSNPGAHEFQNLDVGGGRRLYQLVAERVATEWNRHGNCLLVVGATVPAELADVRARVGDLPFLVPGVGAQGGDVAQAVRAGRTRDGGGLIINSSRGILYAGTSDAARAGTDFAAAARAATQSLRAEIHAALAG